MFRTRAVRPRQRRRQTCLLLILALVFGVLALSDFSSPAQARLDPPAQYFPDGQGDDVPPGVTNDTDPSQQKDAVDRGPMLGSSQTRSNQLVRVDDATSGAVGSPHLPTGWLIHFFWKWLTYLGQN
jgi:hypothetical protein